MRQLRYGGIAIAIAVICVYFISTRIYLIGIWNSTSFGISIVNVNSPTCPKGLDNMFKGKWIPGNISPKQQKELDMFLESYRGSWGLPKSLQRDDLQCGNASFSKDPKAPYRFFRALCSPGGKTPCCMNNKCVSKKVDECKCDNCLDLRQRIHAEYSHWVPDNPQCKIKIYQKNEPCQVLDGMTVLISGDSLMRHVYIAFQKLLNHDLVWGSLKKTARIDKLEKCKGMYSFTEKECRVLMATETSEMCNGRVNLTFVEYYNSGLAGKFIHQVESLTRKPKSIVIAGIAHHDDFNAKLVYKQYIGPAIQIVKQTKWPRLLWTMPSAQGLLREVKTKTPQKMLNFKNEMTKLLKNDNVPSFDAYSITKDVMSMDGIHHGIGVNLQKVQMMLNIISEMRYDDSW